MVNRLDNVQPTQPDKAKQLRLLIEPTVKLMRKLKVRQLVIALDGTVATWATEPEKVAPQNLIRLPGDNRP